MERRRLRPPNPDPEVELAGVTLKNPVLLASGCFGFGPELAALDRLHELGGLVLKTITPEPRSGYPPAQRTVETPSGMVNAIGVENPGLEAFIKEKLPGVRELGATIIVSIAGYSTDDFARMAARLDAEPGIAALELNVSSPNLPGGGMIFGTDASLCAKVMREVKRATRLPIIPKLTPNVTDIASIARACEEAGADAISLINTFSAMCIDIETRRPILAANFGGLSGPAIRPAAVLRVFQVARAVRIPVIGVGGIWDWRDALEFIIAGATAVQVGTALFYDPRRGHEIVAGIRRFMRERGIASIKALVGSVALNPVG
jgi:dihydroorotate dehydrogenase (NAD+) catalytic subunit